jgi:hypothetical protein
MGIQASSPYKQHFEEVIITQILIFLMKIPIEEISKE